MGIIGYISSMKKKHQDKQYQRAREDAEGQREEIRKLKVIREHRENIQRIKAQKKHIRQLKHPFLTKSLKKVKGNVVKKMKQSKKDASKPTKMQSSENIFSSGFSEPFSGKKKTEKPGIQW